MKKSEKKKLEIAYKLIPRVKDRISFFVILWRVLLNAFFTVYNINFGFTLVTTKGDDTVTFLEWFFFIGTLVTSGADAYLFLVSFLQTLYNTKALIERLVNGQSVHFQVKNMATQIREMASTSILRFLATGESTNRLRQRWKDSCDEILLDCRFAVENARKHKLTVRVRESIYVGFVVFGPILALFSLMFKIETLAFGSNINSQQLFEEKNEKTNDKCLVEFYNGKLYSKY